MPMVAAAAIGWGASAAITALGAPALVAGIGGAVASGLASTVLARGSDNKSKVTEAQAQGTLINVADNVAPLPVIYGSRRVGGIRVFCETSNYFTLLNVHLNQAIVLCEGPVSAIGNVYYDGEVNSSPRFSPFGVGSLIVEERNLGADDQATSALLFSLVPSKWTTSHRLRGVAYVAMQLTYTDKAFAGGIPTVTADVDGRLVYDPRDAVTKFSNNPALCIWDFLTNTRYGRGIPSSSLDSASFVSAANHCDEAVSCPDGAGGTTTQARYTLDGTISPDDDWLDNLRAMLTACRGTLIFSGGLLKLVIDKADAPISFAFTEDNIVGDWQIDLPGKRDKLNRVRARFYNAAREWQPDLAIWDDASARSEDGGRLLEREIDLPFTSNLYRAQRIAEMEGKQSRQSIRASFRATVEALRCEVGDIVPITHTSPGWSSKLFRITRLELTETDEVMVTVREYQSAHYTPGALADANVAPATNLPNPYTVAAPTGLSVSSGNTYAQLAADGTVIARMRITWTQVPDQFVQQGGRVEIQYKPSADSAWTDATPAQGDATEAIVGPIRSGVAYDVRIRAVNVIGRQSDWTSTSHSATGKSAGPAAPTGLTGTSIPKGHRLAWTLSGDLDRAYTEIWANDTTNNVATASRIAITDSNTWDRVGLSPLAGAYYWVRDVNFSRVAGSYNAGATSGTFVQAAFVQAADLSVGRLDAITANMGNLTAGTIDLAYDPGGTSWGYIRSFGKWWDDTNNGWIVARHQNGQVFLEFRGGTSRFKVWDFGGGNTGIQIETPQFSVVNGNASFSGTLAADTVTTNNLVARSAVSLLGGTIYFDTIYNTSGQYFLVLDTGQASFDGNPFLYVRDLGVGVTDLIGNVSTVQVIIRRYWTGGYTDEYNYTGSSNVESHITSLANPGGGTWGYQIYIRCEQSDFRLVRLVALGSFCTFHAKKAQ